MFSCKKQLKSVIRASALVGLFTIHGAPGLLAEPSAPTYLPNNYGKSITTPVAWCASGNVVFAGVGGTRPSSYSPASDGACLIGIGVGDPREYVALQGAIVSLDLTGWQDYSLSLQLSRELGHADAISIGAESIMLTGEGDADQSFYIVYSKGVQGEPFVNRSNGQSRLHYSIGAGTNRFARKSPFDIANGKGRNGTALFTNIAYDVFGAFNAIVDWNGVNLNAGASKSFTLIGFPVVATFGAADLTNNSGDRVRAVFGIGTGFKL